MTDINTLRHRINWQMRHNNFLDPYIRDQDTEYIMREVTVWMITATGLPEHVIRPVLKEMIQERYMEELLEQ